MTLSGMELRKAACGVVFGWTRFQNYGNGGGFWHRNGCEEYASNSSCECGGSWYLPAIESDAAVSEPFFLEWCEKNDYRWTLEAADSGGFYCTIRKLGHGPVAPVAIANGSSPSEARARAIVIASAQEVRT